MAKIPSFNVSYRKGINRWVFVAPDYAVRYGEKQKPKQKVFRFLTKNEAELNAKKYRDSYKKNISTVTLSSSEKENFCHKVEKLGFSFDEALQTLHDDKNISELSPTFGFLLDRYLLKSSQKIQSGKSSDWNWTYRQIEKLRPQKIHELNFEFWTNWLASWRDEYDAKSEKALQSGFNRLKSRLNGIFNLAMSHGLISVHPLKDIHSMNIDKTEIKIVTPKELKYFLDDCVTHYPELIPYFTVLFFAGVRPKSEAPTISWHHFHLSIDKLEVYATKTRQKREIDLAPNLKKWLTPYIDSKKEGLIVSSYDATTKPRKKLCEGIGKTEKLFDWSHDVSRHSYATYFEAAFRHVSGNLERLRVNMGHKSYDMINQNYKSFVKEHIAEDYWIEPTKKQIQRIKDSL